MQVAGGQVSGDTGRVPVAAGTEVTLSSSPATSPTRSTCTATTAAASSPQAPRRRCVRRDIPGVFEVELEQRGVPLAQLQVA